MAKLQDPNCNKLKLSLKLHMWRTISCKFNLLYDLLYYSTKHSEAITNPPASTKIYKDSWDFDLYVDELNRSISCEIFKHQSWIQFYYTWAGFQNYNLVVRVNLLDKQDPLCSFLFIYLGHFWLFLCINFPEHIVAHALFWCFFLLESRGVEAWGSTVL